MQLEGQCSFSRKHDFLVSRQGPSGSTGTSTRQRTDCRALAATRDASDDGSQGRTTSSCHSCSLTLTFDGPNYGVRLNWLVIASNAKRGELQLKSRTAREVAESLCIHHGSSRLRSGRDNDLARNSNG